MSVTPTRRDVTRALRARRYRQKMKSNDFNAGVMVEPVFDAPGAAVITTDRAVIPTDRTPISTPEMCALAARLSNGLVSHEDLQLADKLIMALVDGLPPDSMIDLTD
jgi:hypothetical protein